MGVYWAKSTSDRTLLQVLEVRRILEAATAALAAQYITDEVLAELQRVVEVEAWARDRARSVRRVARRLTE
jgi:DNA-binding FadR family transcriptional regulator